MHPIVHILSVVGFCFLRSVPPAVLVVATAFVNPLNVVSATDRASQDIFFRYIAPLYGEEHQPITVILMDDQFVEAVGSSWPVPHRTMTRFLKTLYCYNPKSIFFDLLFTHEHSVERHTEQFISYLKGDKQLHEKIIKQCATSFVHRDQFEDDPHGYQRAVAFETKRLEETILPLPTVYIGDLAPQKNYPVEGGRAVFDDLIHHKVKRLPTNWVAEDGAYPLVLTLDDKAAFGDAGPAAHGVGLDGALKKNQPDIWQGIWPEHNKGKVPSAALALYAAFDKKNLKTLLEEEQNELIVEWGFYPRHLPKEAMTAAEHGRPEEFLRLRRFPDGCHHRPDDISPSFLDEAPPVDRFVQSFAPLKESVWQFMLDTIGMLNSNPGQPRQTCPYNQWVPAEAVLFASTRGQQKTLRALFEDRVVMIGADIRGAPDLVQSPVHGQIPGVFLHAMALDNLLERDLERYWRPMPTLPEREYLPAIVSKMSIGTSIELCLLFLIFAFSDGVTRWRKSAGERWSEGVYTGVELLGHVTLVFGTVAALAAYAIAPMNWLGLVTLAVSKDIIQRFQMPKIQGGSILRLRSKSTE